MPAACLFRFNVLSLVYLLFLLLLPWFPGPSQRGAGGKGFTGVGGAGRGWAACGRLRFGYLPSFPCGFPPARQRGSVWQPRSVNYSPVRLLIGLQLQKWAVWSPSLINPKPQGWAVPAEWAGMDQDARDVGLWARLGVQGTRHPWWVRGCIPPDGCMGRVPPRWVPGARSPAWPLPAVPGCNTARQRLARPQLKALPSEYFMGLHGPGCCRELLPGFTGKNKRRESFWRGATPRLVRSCGGLAACPMARKTGGWDGGTAAAAGRSDGARGVGNPTTQLPHRDLPALGMLSCTPMLVLVCRGGRVFLGPCIAPCLSFPSNAAEGMLSGCAGCTVRHARSWWDTVPRADPWHLQTPLPGGAGSPM